MQAYCGAGGRGGCVVTTACWMLMKMLGACLPFISGVKYSSIISKWFWKSITKWWEHYFPHWWNKVIQVDLAHSSLLGEPLVLFNAVSVTHSGPFWSLHPVVTDMGAIGVKFVARQPPCLPWASCSGFAWVSQSPAFLKKGWSLLPGTFPAPNYSPDPIKS